MPRNVELTNELFRIYLRDESEKANLAAINAIVGATKGDIGALFYDDARNRFRFCLSGSDFPISLGRERWHECVDRRIKKDAPDVFESWTPPGFDMSIRHWMSAPLYAAGSGLGYVFIGRDSGPWSGEELKVLGSITGVIAEIVVIRHRKDLEARNRREAEIALAATERRMSDFFSLARDMMYTSDNDGIVTGINPAGVALLGSTGPENVVGRSLADFVSNPSTYDYFLERVHDAGYIDDFEILLNEKEGEPVFCTISAHEVHDGQGRTLEIQGLVKDITDRIRNERELWKTNLELAEVNLKLQQTQEMMVRHEKLASIGQLAAGIAHEINNPLGFLRSNHAMLAKYSGAIVEINRRLAESGDERYRALSEEFDIEYILGEIEHIFAESDEGYERIKRIVANLMSFSRMDKASEFDLVDINAGIENTILVAWNEIKYVAEVDRRFGDIPKVYAHGGEINQVVLNILVNAAHAIGSQKRAEKGTITVRTEKIEGSVVISIADDGPGMSDEVRSRVFDPFFTTKEPGKGTGLGLSISYEIVVNKHKGTLTVESVPGAGATFRIGLPILQNS